MSEKSAVRTASTVGRDEEEVRNCIKEQEKEDQRMDQLEMFK